LYETEEADKHKRSSGAVMMEGDEDRAEEGAGVWQRELSSTGAEMRYCRQQ